MSENSVNAISGGLNSSAQYSPVDIDAKAARKKGVNNQLQNLINPQNSLPPTPDWYGQKESNGVTAFYG